MDKSQVQIQLHCQNLPGREFEGRTSVRLGIQKGDVVIEDVAGDTQSVTFTATFTISINPTIGKPNFTGPFAHGTPTERFLYLCWGERHQGAWAGFRRAKIHLRDLSREDIEAAIQSGEPIKAVINMTDDKGGPLCASVKADKIRWEL